MQLLSFTKTTLQRMAKAGHYLLRGDVSGLGEEINQYRQWKQIQQLGHLAVDLQKHVTPPAPLHNTESVQLSEAEFWDQVDISEVRQVSWSSAGGDVLGKWALEKMTGGRYEKINDLILDHIRAEHAELVGLVLGCGDMTGEQPYFTDPRFPFAKVDAIDISTASMERAKVLTDSVGLNVNYIAADVNHLELEPSTYDLIILFHAYHHFEEVDHIAQISNNALKPGGRLLHGRLYWCAAHSMDAKTAIVCTADPETSAAKISSGTDRANTRGCSVRSGRMLFPRRGDLCQPDCTGNCKASRCRVAVQLGRVAHAAFRGNRL
ncbi:class I SAM-dependent methyltransferase [Chloroflexi bacterium TSY]|nr:class I SAM-dependent methyltransferase [Chloroflexi bacterium TSY]